MSRPNFYIQDTNPTPTTTMTTEETITQRIEDATTLGELQSLEGSLDALYNAGSLTKQELIIWDLRCCDRYDAIILEHLDSVPPRTK
jgi:hypothetical protein